MQRRDARDRLVYVLPFDLFNPQAAGIMDDEHLMKRAMYGIPQDGDDWAAILKRRASLSTLVQRDATPGVPKMSLREYDRWKEGVRLDLATLLPSCWLTCSQPGPNGPR